MTNPNRTQSETRLKVMLTAEIVVSTDDTASKEENRDYINMQLKDATDSLNATHTGFEHIKLEGEV